MDRMAVTNCKNRRECLFEAKPFLGPIQDQINSHSLKMWNALLFHDISRDLRSHSSVSPTTFEYCVQMVLDSNNSVETVAMAAARDQGSVFSFTFDDGFHTDYTTVFPILVRHGISATFFTITSNIGAKDYLAWSEIRELEDAGMEIGSHTHSHPFLTRLATSKLTDELVRSKALLEDNLGTEVHSLAIPSDDYDHRVLCFAAEAGYTNICISEPGLNKIPLASGTPIRRNAAHRLINQYSLRRLVSPSSSDKFVQAAHYHLRRTLKRTLSSELYMSLRDKTLSFWNKA